MASELTEWRIWLCPQKFFKVTEMMQNAINTVFLPGQAAMGTQLVLFLDCGYPEITQIKIPKISLIFYNV